MAVAYWPDMRSVNFGAPTAVDDTEPGQGASILVCISDQSAKGAIPFRAGYNLLNDPSFEWLWRGFMQVVLGNQRLGF
jgi:hypothetical protein